MHQWVPASTSTPLDRPMRQTTGQNRAAELSAIAASPNFDFSAKKLRSPTKTDITDNKNDIPTRQNRDTSFASLLSPKFHDENDSLLHPVTDYSAIGLPSFSSNEKMDLEQANSYLQDCITKDLMKSDIAEQLVGTNAGLPQSPSASGAHPDDYVNGDVSHFRIAQEFPVSEMLSKALSENESGYKGMGSFPELKMVYAFLETRLYVWPWDNHRLITMVEYPEFITAVGLLPTWSSGFLYLAAPFVIVVATLTEILFTKVTSVTSTFSIETNTTNTTNGTNGTNGNEFVLRTSSNENRFNKIQTTKEGRCFLGSTEGQVFELQNIKETIFTKWAWFGPRLANCTLAVYERIASALPGFHLLFRKEPIVQMVMDETRKILYTLRKDNNVDLYDLGVDGNANARHIHLSFQNIVSQATPLLRNVDRLQIKEIISIHILNVFESVLYSFFLLSSSGLRLFFSFSNAKNRPKDFFLGHIRFPPGHNPSTVTSQRGVTSLASHFFVSDSFYLDGTILMVTEGTEGGAGAGGGVGGEEGTEIVVASNDLYVYEEKYRESYSVTAIPYNVLAISQVQQRPQDSLIVQSRSLALNQLMTTRQQLLVVTEKKCFLLEKSYPVDILEKVLRSGSPMSSQVRDFVESLPPFQSCFLALHLACITTSGEVARMATRILRVYGSEPVRTVGGDPTVPVRTGSSGPTVRTGGGNEFVRTGGSEFVRTGGGSDFVRTGGGTQPTQTVGSLRGTVTFSAKHDALYYLFGRIVAPFWNVCPFVFGAEFKGAVAWISGIPPGDVSSFVEQLSLVKRFLETNWNEMFFFNSGNEMFFFNSGRTGRVHLPTEDVVQSVQLMKSEMASVKSLIGLMDNTVQLLKLWEFLLKEGLTQVLEYVMRVFTKETLVLLTVADLLVTPTGRGVVDGIVKALHQRYVDEGTDMESVLRISEYLQQLCPNLFGTDDAVTMKVLTMIDKARVGADGATSVAMLDHALDLVRPNAAILGLREILDRLTERGFYEGAVELCGLAALQSDVQNFAVKAAIEGEVPLEGAGRVAVEQRERYYGMVTKILTDLEMLASGRGGATQPGGSTSETLKPSEARLKLECVLDWIYTHSSDVLLHFHVLDWCLTVCERYVLLSNSPFLKDFLFRKYHFLQKTEINVEKNVRLLKLIGDFSERAGDKMTAAFAFLTLGSHDAAQIHVLERVEFFSRCEILCQTLKVRGGGGGGGGEGEGEMKEFLSSLRANSILANIQKDVYQYAEEKCLGVVVSPDSLARLTYDVLDLQKIFNIATEINAPQWTLVVLSVGGEPPNVQLIAKQWGRFLQNVLEYSTKKGLGREARIALIAAEISKVRAHLSPADQYCTIDTIVEGFERAYVTYGNFAENDPAFVLDCVVNGLGQDIFSVVDVYQRLYEKFAANPNLSSHLLRVHVAIVNTLIDDSGRRPLPKDRRRLLLSNYVRIFDGYLRTAMRQQSVEEDVLVELQATNQRLTSFASSGGRI